MVRIKQMASLCLGKDQGDYSSQESENKRKEDRRAAQLAFCVPIFCNDLREALFTNCLDCESLHTPP